MKADKLKIKKRYIVLIVFAILALFIFISSQFEAVQKAIARLTVSVYVTLRHSGEGFSYYDVEYSPQFGEYSVFYKYPDSKTVAFPASPKAFPILVPYDPLNFP